MFELPAGSLLSPLWHIDRSRSLEGQIKDLASGFYFQFRVAPNILILSVQAAYVISQHPEIEAFRNVGDYRLIPTESMAIDDQFMAGVKPVPLTNSGLPVKLFNLHVEEVQNLEESFRNEVPGTMYDYAVAYISPMDKR